MNHEQHFLSYFEKVKAYHGGYFDAPLPWHQEAIKKHEKIREFLGDWRKTIPVDLERNDNELVSYDIVSPYYTKLSAIIPGYFSSYGLMSDCFQNILVPCGVQKGMAWGKHISHWMKREKISKEIQQQVSNIVSQLGIAYAKQKTTKDKYYVNICTAPEAFVSIGHYGIDNGSCFKFGALNEAHKFIIGENENTFVGLISRKPIEYEVADVDGVLMRFWGIASDDFSRFDICNIYPRHPDNQGNIYKSISKAFAELAGVEKSAEEYGSFRVQGVFMNKESPITYYNSNKIKNLRQKIYNFNDKYSFSARRCIRCAKTADSYEQIDFSQYCTKCAKEGFNICNLTKQKSMLRLVAAKKQGQPMMVCETALMDYFKPVKMEFHHIDDVEKVNGKFQLKVNL